MARSVVNALEASLVSALKGNATLVGLLASPGIYNGIAPSTAPGDYLVLGSVSERDVLFFQASQGKGIALTGHIWCVAEGRVSGKTKAMQIYEQVEVTLNRTILSVSNNIMLRGSCNLVSVVPDPGGKWMHGVFSYEAELLNA